MGLEHNEILTTTPEHPFYVTERKSKTTLEKRNLSKALENLSEKWIPASDLEIGDTVLTSSGQTGTVTLVRTFEKTQEMYNLEVARAESFTVGSRGWVVHNADRLYPNKLHPVTGVQFDPTGYPQFDSSYDAKIPSNLQGPTVSDGKQFRDATRQLREAMKNDPILESMFDQAQKDAIDKGLKKIPGYTWHHDPYNPNLQLVDSNTHAKTGHEGGRKVTGGRPCGPPPIPPTIP